MQGEILWMLISIAASIQLTLKLTWRLIPVKVRSRRGWLTQENLLPDN